MALTGFRLLVRDTGDKTFSVNCLDVVEEKLACDCISPGQ